MMSGLIPKKWLIFKNKSARRLSKDERLKYGSKANTRRPGATPL